MESGEQRVESGGWRAENSHLQGQILDEGGSISVEISKICS